MTSQPPKGYATLSRTINLGRFSSIKIELSEEFLIDKSTHLKTIMALDKRIQEVVKVLRIAQAND